MDVVLIFFSLFLISCTMQEEIVKENIGEKGLTETIEVENMKLTSSAFKHNENIPAKYTCEGQDISPPLTIKDIPAEAKSLTLIMDDPDAIKPAGKVWDHWIVWNISVNSTEIPEGKEPQGVHGKGTGGNLDYHGPCPPDAEHRYYFKLYALDIKLNLPEGATKAEVEKAMKDHILAKAELMGKYEKKRK